MSGGVNSECRFSAWLSRGHAASIRSPRAQASSEHTAAETLQSTAYSHSRSLLRTAPEPATNFLHPSRIFQQALRAKTTSSGRSQTCSTRRRRSRSHCRRRRRRAKSWPFVSRSEIQPRYSRDVAEMQPRCSRDAADRRGCGHAYPGRRCLGAAVNGVSAL